MEVERGSPSQETHCLIKQKAFSILNSIRISVLIEAQSTVGTLGKKQITIRI